MLSTVSSAWLSFSIVSMYCNPPFSDGMATTRKELPDSPSPSITSLSFSIASVVTSILILPLSRMLRKVLVNIYA